MKIKDKVQAMMYMYKSVTLTNVVLAITVCEFTPQCLGRLLVDAVKKWVCLRSVADHHRSLSGMVCWGNVQNCTSYINYRESVRLSSVWYPVRDM